jgi:hypothetical protein
MEDVNDDALIRLHEILYSTRGKNTRKAVLSWRPGSAESVAKRDQIFRGLSSPTETLGTVLKEICVMLGLGIGSDRNVIVEDIVEFLTKPVRTPPAALFDTIPKRGRKPGSKNRPKEEVLAAASASPKTGRPGRKKGSKNNPEYQSEYLAGTRRRPGRPKKYNEDRAFLRFVYSEFPGVIRAWTKLQLSEKFAFDSVIVAEDDVMGNDEDVTPPAVEDDEEFSEVESPIVDEIHPIDEEGTEADVPPNSAIRLLPSKPRGRPLTRHVVQPLVDEPRRGIPPKRRGRPRRA